MKKILSLFVIAGLLFSMNSCNKNEDATDTTTTTSTTDDTTTDDDDDTVDYTAENAASETLINGSSDDLENAIGDLFDTDGMNAAMDLMEIFNDTTGGRSLPNADNELTFAQTFVTNLTTTLSAANNGDDDDEEDWNPFDHPGTYTYDEADSNNWTYDSTQAGVTGEYVIFNYPTAGSATNNATLTIKEIDMHEWEDTDWNGDIEMHEEPKRVDAELEVNGTKVVDIDFTAAYDDENEPTSVDADIEMTPFKLSVDFSRTSTSVSLDASFHKGTEALLGADIEAKLDAEGEPNAITASLDFFKISIEAEMDFSQVDSTTEMDIDYVNNHMDVKIYTYPGNVLIGQVNLEEDPNGGDEPVFYVTHANSGKKVELEDFVTGVVEKLEEFICENFDDC